MQPDNSKIFFRQENMKICGTTPIKKRVKESPTDSHGYWYGDFDYGFF